MLKPMKADGQEGRRIIRRIRERGAGKDRRVDAAVAEILEAATP